MGDMISFVVPLPPITKKNHQRILKNFKTGKPFVSPSAEYKSYESQALWFIPKTICIDYPREREVSILYAHTEKVRSDESS